MQTRFLGPIMLAAALTLAVTVAPKPALADNGAIAAGVVGGLAVGAIVGSQINRDEGYRERHHYRAGYRQGPHGAAGFRRSLRPHSCPSRPRLRLIVRIVD